MVVRAAAAAAAVAATRYQDFRPHSAPLATATVVGAKGHRSAAKAPALGRALEEVVALLELVALLKLPA